VFRIFPRHIVSRLGWTTGAFAISQVIRFASNLILTRLLSPPLFGLMVIVNSIRTGVELLSDVGIGQNIVSNKRGTEPDFYDTAWTIKAMRGVMLGAACLLLSDLFAEFFDEPQLSMVLPLIALTFLFTGFQSAGPSLLLKQGKVARISIFEIGTAAISLLVHTALAFVTQTVWALVLGSVIASAVSLVASYLIVPELRHRFVIHSPSAKEILVFGKWIFLSSIIYFFASNFDRLYFAKQISLTLLGVYGIAKALADILTNLVIRSTNMVLFPTVAAMRSSPAEIRGRLLHARRNVLLLMGAGLAGFTALSDLIVNFLYDARYAEAALILPLLLLGVWITILSTVNDSIMLGAAKPAFPAIAQGAKLLTYVIGVPLAFHFSGLVAAILVLNVGEAARYAVLWILSRRQHLGFGRDDLKITLLFLFAIVLFRETLALLGLTSNLVGLYPVLRSGFPIQ
jgi:O-antigen/teichoic acid export membrane protein